MATRRRRRAPVEQQEEEKTTSAAGSAEQEERIILRYKERISNPMTAIRSMCVECMGGAPRLVADCPSKNCSLWPFRMGKNPFHGNAGKAKPPKGSNRGTSKKKATRTR